MKMEEMSIVPKASSINVILDIILIDGQGFPGLMMHQSLFHYPIGLAAIMAPQILHSLK